MTAAKRSILGAARLAAARSRAVILLWLVVAVSSGCARQKAEPPAAERSGVRVTEVSLGRALGTDDTISEKTDAERSAFLVSLTVSLYSGAKVAQVSTPPADQIMSQIQTSAICKPPHARPGSSSLYVRFAESKSPFRNGRTMKTKSGIIKSRPAK